MSLPVDFITVGEARIVKLLFAGSFFQGESIITNANGDLVSIVEEKLASLKRSVVVVSALLSMRSMRLILNMLRKFG
jgi:hypothetical protein